MYEDAYKQQPGNEELGTQTFFANVRIGNWKAAQQVSSSPSPGKSDARCLLSDCHEDAQTVPRRSLLVLECYECSPSGWWMELMPDGLS